MASGDEPPATRADATGGTVPGVSAPDAFAGRVVQRLGRDLAAHPLAEDVHLDRLADLDSGRQPRVGDRAADRVAVAAGRDAPADLPTDANRLVAQRDRTWVVEDEAAQCAARRGVERVASDVVLVAFDAEPQPGLERVDVRRDVGRPDAVALLEAQRVDRPVTAGDEAMRLPRLPQPPPQPRAVLGRAVQLPAELAHEGHPQ